QADVVEIHRAAIADLQAASYNLQYKKAQQIVGLSFQMADKSSPLSKVNVRKAVSLAIDKDALASTILGNTGVTGWGSLWLPPLEPSADQPEYRQASEKPDPYDPAQAKKLLADSGYAAGQVKLQLALGNSFPEQQAIGQAIQQMLNAIGLQVELA